MDFWQGFIILLAWDLKKNKRNKYTSPAKNPKTQLPKTHTRNSLSGDNHALRQWAYGISAFLSCIQYCTPQSIRFPRGLSWEAGMFFLGRGYESCLLVSVCCCLWQTAVCEPLLLEGQIPGDRSEVWHMKIKEDGWRSDFKHHCFQVQLSLGVEEPIKPVVQCLEVGCVAQPPEWGQRLETPRQQALQKGWKVGLALQGVPIPSLFWYLHSFVSLFQCTVTKASNFLCGSGDVALGALKSSWFSGFIGLRKLALGIQRGQVSGTPCFSGAGLISHWYFSRWQMKMKITDCWKIIPVTIYFF